jgi:hypothetical protein
VKCDESTPICIRCQQAGRECTGPLTGVQFVDTGDNVKERAGAAGAMVIFQVLPSRNHWFPVDQLAGNGNLYQKWHRSSIGPSTSAVALSPTERLRYEVIRTFQDSRPGYQLPQITMFEQKRLKDIVRRLGSTIALDNACACLAATYALMTRINPSNQIPLAPYSKALQSMRAALQYPTERFSIPTLAACVVLFFIEISLRTPSRYFLAHCKQEVAGSRNAIGIRYHIAAAARILEARGPDKHVEGFDRDIAFQLQGPIVG